MKKGTKKIKHNGKALSKWGVACLIEQCDVHTHMCIIYDAFSYAELVHKLFDVATFEICGAVDWADYLDDEPVEVQTEVI